MAGWIATLIVVMFAFGTQRQDRWQDAERRIKRLPPSAFKELPREAVRTLEAEGCTIPQLGDPVPDLAPHNVIYGEFVRKGQRDWAVLCSKDGKSTIRVFWSKPTACPAQVRPEEPDVDYLQTGVGETIVYSHRIRAVSERDLRGWSGPPEPGVMKHQGIEDDFEGKTGKVYYCDGRKWIEAACACSDD